MTLRAGLKACTTNVALVFVVVSLHLAGHRDEFGVRHLPDGHGVAHDFDQVARYRGHQLLVLIEVMFGLFGIRFKGQVSAIPILLLKQKPHLVVAVSAAAQKPRRS